MISTPSLHLNSEYSLLESTIKIDDLISFAISNEMKSLVLTDHNTMYGTYEFIKKCEKNNIKPVIGLDLDVEDFRLILLAKNMQGLTELFRLSSKKEGGQGISVNDIDAFNLFVIDHPTKGNYVKTKRQLKLKNFYVGTAIEDFPNAVFVRETKTLKKADARALSLLKSIADGEDIVEEQANGYMEDVDFDATIVKQATSIVENCNIVLPKDVNPFPDFKIPNGITKNDYFRKMISDSAKLILSEVKDKQLYIDRIKSETKTIIELGFVDYFLLIADLVKWSKEQGIIIGPGRGSAAGSLIIFILGITEVDPLKFDLLFERFLNKERVSLPDVDIDIQDDRRSEVVDYLFEKYGHNNVALISTFSRIGAKTALRDSARLNKFPIRDINSISKLVPTGLTLDESFKESARFRAAIERTDEATQVFDDAKLIEGFPRQKGTHAAGIVVSDSPIETKVPTTKGINDNNQTQYTMDYLEENGLIKLDLLGLRNLSIIKMISDEVFNKYSKRINLQKIPLNDRKTNDLLSAGDTDGIFQFESYGMKKTLNEIGVSSFDDVIAILSLYRPGPMDFIPLYAQLKHGDKKTKFISKEFNAIVDDTYGIIIYQEQIMMIAQDVSGMSFGQADILRRAISKKKISLINSLKEAFINGAVEKGYKTETAEEIYSMIEKFANYGFNKSHAVAYGILSYRMAYLKAWFPTEFYTSLIKSSAGSKAQVKKYIDGAKRKGITIISPSIKTSKEHAYCSNDKIFLPLIIIKGFGDAANVKLLKERETNGKYTDFYNAISRLTIGSLGEAQITTLIEAGALSMFGNMQTLLDSLPSALRYTKMITITKDGESSLDKSILPRPILIKAEKNSANEIKNQIKLYGFQLSAFETEGHELDKKLVHLKEGEVLEVVVLFDAIKVFQDANKQDMARITLSDSTRKIEAVIFSSGYRFIKNDPVKSIVKVSIKKVEFNGRESFTIVSPWKVVKNG